ncbi:hypothetical protein COO60DRAFT_187809 [Scenedesmus sp. NREL 46B-D3]|nr:hypothetical protein COO60DRAFT_187809 [Scenedesmus sp. NREL 46B-D3]
MLLHRPVPFRTALQDCIGGVAQLCNAASKAGLHAAELQRIAKLCKRLQPLLEQLGEDAAVEQHQQGVQLLQRVTSRLQDLAGFAANKSAKVGPVYALFHSHSLAQQLANHSINLCSALDAFAAALAGLGASQELQEDLGQLVKQLGRGLHCTYSEAQHSRLLELYVQMRERQEQLPSYSCCQPRHSSGCLLGAARCALAGAWVRCAVMHESAKGNRAACQNTDVFNHGRLALPRKKMSVGSAQHCLAVPLVPAACCPPALCRLRRCAEGSVTPPPCQPSSASRCCSSAAWRSWLPMSRTCNRQHRSSNSRATT